MPKQYVGKITLEVNGLIVANCNSATPSEKILRQRVETMSGDGYIEVAPSFGLAVGILEENSAQINGNWENITNGTITIVLESGLRKIYPNCVCLSENHGGYTPKGEAVITYEFMCDRPSII